MGTTGPPCQPLRSPDLLLQSHPTHQCRHSCFHWHLHTTFRPLLVSLEAGSSGFPRSTSFCLIPETSSMPRLLGTEECHLRGRFSTPPPLQNSLLLIFWKISTYNVFSPFSSWRNKTSPSTHHHRAQWVQVTESKEHAGRFHFFS